MFSIRNRATLMVIAIVLSVAATAVLTIHSLGACDVWGGNEAVAGVFVEQMVEHGKLLFPLQNGSGPMYKPPLFHWTATAIDHLFGIHRVDAFNLRLPSALYATAAAAATVIFVYGRFGPTAALLAGLILAGSYQFISQGRLGRVDMTLTFFETLSLLLFVRWLPPARAPDAPPQPNERPSAGLHYLLAIAMGLAVLSKGPVGAFLPAAAIVIFLLAERRPRDILRLAKPGPLIIGIALASSWYLACFFGGRWGFLDRQLGSENFGRFFGSLGRMRTFYYFWPLLLNSAPMSLLVPFAIAGALRTYRRDGGATHALAEPSGQSSRRNAVDPSIRLFAIFWIVTVVFFSLAAYKRRAYLLPLWPTAAIVLAWWLESIARHRWGRILRNATAAACVALIGFLFFFLPYKEIRDCDGQSFRVAAQQINRAVGPQEPLYLYGFHAEMAPMLFYLHRNAPRLHGKLGNAPPGYIVVPAKVWRERKHHAPGLDPVLTIPYAGSALILLHHGKLYAAVSHAD